MAANLLTLPRRAVTCCLRRARSARQLSLTGGQYQALAQVTGAVTAGVGQGGRILAVYKDGGGLSAGSDVLWRNPLNFSGSTQVQDTFSANTGAVTMQLALESDLDAGHLAFSGLGLQHLTASDVIRRSTYSVGGQATAVKVQGDPDAGKNGIFFLYTDHLGSTSVMSYGYNLNGSLHPQAGQVVAGSEARYLPFGGWRGAEPTANLTDRGYTGHKSNNLGSNDLGLIYMNARFYAPGVSRFVTADTLVPNPANPQSFNRFSYSYNNPIKYTDASGHCVDGLTTLACIAAGVVLVTKVLDYGLTIWDGIQAGRVLSDPNASQGDRLMAGLTVGLAVLFEAIEPDDVLPIGLPADDIARRAILNGAEEALEEGGQKR